MHVALSNLLHQELLFQNKSMKTKLDLNSSSVSAEKQ